MNGQGVTEAIFFQTLGMQEKVQCSFSRFHDYGNYCVLAPLVRLSLLQGNTIVFHSDMDTNFSHECGNSSHVFTTTIEMFLLEAGVWPGSSPEWVVWLAALKDVESVALFQHANRSVRTVLSFSYRWHLSLQCFYIWLLYMFFFLSSNVETNSEVGQDLGQLFCQS